MSIVLVDDSVDDLMLIEHFLRRGGYADLILARSAQEAIDFLRKDGQSSSVDLIILDVLMPGIDGIEACRRIKADDLLRDIPVIMATARDDHKSLQTAFEAGAVDYITKPISAIELLSRVRSVLNLKHKMDSTKARERDLLELARQLQDVNKTLQQLAVIDALTDVANRHYFDEYFEQEWKRSRREATPLSLIIIDIDFFKDYNDTYGHIAGDLCLRRIATALKESLRRPADLLARYGGEEFVVVLPDTDMEGAKAVAEEMRLCVEGLAMPHAGSSVSNHVTISLGVASLICKYDSCPASLLASADNALYDAKREGRNRIKSGPITEQEEMVAAFGNTHKTRSLGQKIKLPANKR